jgi:hypothetical protein
LPVAILLDEGADIAAQAIEILILASVDLLLSSRFSVLMKLAQRGLP